MLVDVVELRRHGEKRPREMLRALTPIRAELSLTEDRPGWYPGQRRPPLLAGLVLPGIADWAIPPLDKAWVRKIRGTSLLIQGEQQVTMSGRDRDLKVYPQSWWCCGVMAPETIQAEVRKLLLNALRRCSMAPSMPADNWLDQFHGELGELHPELKVDDTWVRALQTLADAADLTPAEAAQIYAAELPPAEPGMPGD